MIAVIVGGAECVWNDLEQLDCQEKHFFITNSMIKYFEGMGCGVTLHPEKIPGWLLARSERRLPKINNIFAQRRFGQYCTVFPLTWRGSVSLFAIEIARKYYNHEKIILCGCPMTKDGGHFERKEAWRSAEKFRQGWIKHLDELKPFVRSLSGWTKEIFGAPSGEWLQNRREECGSFGSQ